MPHPHHLGSLLQTARLASGLSIEEASAHLFIDDAYLQALETLELSTLPGRAYAIGYFKRYTQFLELDTEHLLPEFLYVLEHGAPRPKTEFTPVPVPTIHAAPSWALWTGLALMVASALWHNQRMAFPVPGSEVPLPPGGLHRTP
jgi:cytoskeleton protein RodZ